MQGRAAAACGRVSTLARSALQHVGRLAGKSGSTRQCILHPQPVPHHAAATTTTCQCCLKQGKRAHPTFRHVPPRAPRPSTHATFIPSCAALMAAT